MKFLILLIVCFLFIGTAQAQKTKPKFSSLYSDLSKSCKTIKGGEGQDDAFDCRGVGGYRIYNWSAAAVQMFAVKIPNSEDMINFASQNLDFDTRKTKVEWRMANGKPFAVIMRIDKYAGNSNNDTNFFGKKIGTELVVKGLKGFEKIEFRIDGKARNANEAARKLADAAFLGK